MDQTLFTYKDAIDQVADYLGALPTEEAYRASRRAILEAYREIATQFRWSYYYQRGRINTVASYDTGTVAYDDTGGTYERMLTLSSGTWPTWAAYGTVVIDSVPYDVAERKSATVLTLTAATNPGADVASGTSYTIYRDTYPMPADFVAADQFTNVDGGASNLCYRHPREWVLLGSQGGSTPSAPSIYSFTSDPNYVGSMAVRFWPPPDDIYAYDFIYQRRPRPLTVDNYSTQTVSVTASSATVTGSGTAFASKHAGSVIRLSSGSVNVPTGLAGLYPPEVERTILSVDSATQLTVDAVFSSTLSGVKYIISDPIDVEEGTLLNAFLRCCELQASIGRNMKSKGDAMMAYERAVVLAREADSRNFSRRAAGTVPLSFSRSVDADPIT